MEVVTPDRQDTVFTDREWRDCERANLFNALKRVHGHAYGSGGSALKIKVPDAHSRRTPIRTHLPVLSALMFEAENMRGAQMQSEIKVGQRFKFNILADGPAAERQAVVTHVLSNREEGFGPEVDFFFSYWVEAHELPETGVSTPLVFERGTDGNAYLDGRMVSITMLT
jgi:hypothetical protein